LSKKRKFFCLIFIIIIFVSLSIQFKKQKYFRLFSFPSFYIFSPVLNLIHTFCKAIEGIYHRYIYLVSVEEENEKLKKQLSDMKNLNLQLEEIMMENERLRKLLLLKEKLSFETIAAEVIGENPSAWSKTIIINKGKKDGIKKYLPVISPEGLVGKIIEVYPTSAMIQLIIDKDSGVPVLIKRTRERGILVGGFSNFCYLKYLPRFSDVKVNDIVLTSGFGVIYPKDILVGEVVSVKKDSISPKVKVKPFVNFSRLEEVLIIKK